MIDIVYNRKLLPTTTMSVPGVPKYLPSKAGVADDKNATNSIHTRNTVI